MQRLSHRCPGDRPPLSHESIGRVAGNEEKLIQCIQLLKGVGNTLSCNFPMHEPKLSHFLGEEVTSPIERNTNHFSTLHH